MPWMTVRKTVRMMARTLAGLAARLTAAAAAALMVAGLMTGAQATPVAALELKFSDFFVSPLGPRGPQVTPLLRSAHGQKVRITGYMVVEEEAPVGRFFLSPRPLSMSEHADGDANDLPASALCVLMPPGQRSEPLGHTPGLLRLTGQLQVGRQEMEDGRVTWVRLLLDPKP